MLLKYDMMYRLFNLLKRFSGRPGILQYRAKRFYRWYRNIFIEFLFTKFRVWLEEHPVSDGLNTEYRKERYTVSLTSFPARIDYVHLPIETLMRQKFKPDRIVLWLADSQFPDRVLPQKLRDLEKRGLTIRFCDDLKSHKKYFYTFQEYPDDHIILADDDLFYARDTLSKLVSWHEKYPRDIIALTVQIIGPKLTSLPSEWPAVKYGEKHISSVRAQAFTGAGSLFPAGWYPDEVFNKEKAMELAGTADDLWLKAMSLISGVRTTLVEPVRGFPAGVDIPNNPTLYSINCGSEENLNDKAWRMLVEEYNLHD